MIVPKENTVQQQLTNELSRLQATVGFGGHLQVI